VSAARSAAGAALAARRVAGRAGRQMLCASGGCACTLGCLRGPGSGCRGCGLHGSHGSDSYLLAMTGPALNLVF